MNVLLFSFRKLLSTPVVYSNCFIVSYRLNTMIYKRNSREKDFNLTKLYSQREEEKTRFHIEKLVSYYF